MTATHPVNNVGTNVSVTKDIFTSKFTLWFVLSVGLIITFAATLFMKSSVEKIAEKDFADHCGEIQTKVSERLEDHARILQGGAAFFDATDKVTREKWWRFTRQQRVDKQLPGIQGVGFSLLMPRNELPKHISEIRSQGFPDYTVRPNGERELYSSIIYLEPFSGRNLRAFGYDMFSEPTRRAAMERARDANDAALSGKVVLVQETDKEVQAGTLMYVPVYRKGAPIETVEQRRAAIYGWVYSAYRMNDLMQGIIGDRNLEKDKLLHLQIFDGEQPSPGILLYSCHPAEDVQRFPDIRLTKLLPVDFHGKRWTLRFTQTGGGFSSVEYIRVWLTLANGIVITLLLFALVRTLQKGRADALGMVAARTEELRNERLRLSNIIAGTKAGTWEWNIQTGETSFNEQWAGIIGYTLEEISPVSIESWMKFAHPDDLQKSRELLEKHFRGESDYYECEARMKHINGQWVWVLDRGKVASWSDDGKPIWMFGTHLDITSRKKLENELVKIMEVSPSGIWRTDSAGLNTYVSESWSKITGISAEMAVGHGWSTALHPDDRERVFNEWHITAISDAKLYQSEFRFLRGDGSVVWALCLSVAITDDENRTLEWVGSVSDITNLKDTEIQLQTAKAAAESANIAKGRFLATMSHEIRTPMNGLIGLIQLLQHTELTQEQQEYAENAKHAGIELVQILNDILDLSKVEAGKIELERAEFELYPMVSGTINLMELSAREKGLNLTCSIESDIPAFFKGDAGRIRQVITNLIGNAIKFTSRGAITLHIRKDAEDETSATLRFLVRDSGIGIAADKLKYIFEPFTQANSSTNRTYGGTGLGLAISKQLVELMGGSIGAESTEGEGATFWFTVVMEKLADKAVDAPAPLIPRRILEGGGTKSSTSIRILLAEDDPRAQKIVPRLLKNYGYLVDVAGDGTATLQALEANDYALVLMDCMMPEMSGYEVTAVIRDPSSAVRRHDIPVIALTGNAMKKDVEVCIAAGMDDHLPKPLILEDLLAKLEKYLKEETKGL